MIIKRFLLLAICFFCAWSVAAERVVSLSPALSEIVCHLGGCNALVGRSSACNYPENVQSIPVVGRFGIPDLERIIELKPDWVIGNDLMNPQVAQKLKQLGIKVDIHQIESPEDYCYWVKLIGEKLNKTREAEAELVRFNETLQKLDALAPLNINVLWIVNERPLMVAAAGSLPDTILQMVKVRNAAGAVKTPYFKCSVEWLMQSKVDAIIWALPGEMDRNSRVWGRLEAIRGNRVIGNIADSSLMRPGPRWLDEVTALRTRLENLTNGN